MLKNVTDFMEEQGIYGGPKTIYMWSCFKLDCDAQENFPNGFRSDAPIRTEYVSFLY